MNAWALVMGEQVSRHRAGTATPKHTSIRGTTTSSHEQFASVITSATEVDRISTRYACRGNAIVVYNR